MTCAETEFWMLAARSADDLPQRARRHLDGCARCAVRFDRLTRADAIAAQLAPAPNPEGRARLDERIAQTPQQSPVPPAEPAPEQFRPRPLRAPRWAMGLVAAVLLVGGWLVGRFGTPRPVAQAPDPPRPETHQPPLAQVPGPSPPEARQLPVAPKPAPAPGLLARTARHAGRVAADADPAAQLDALGAAAADLRSDALKRAATGDVENLPRLVGLHDRLLKFGVARQLRRVPEPKRTATAAETADELSRSADAVVAAAGQLPPTIGDMLRPLAASCRESGAALGQDQPAPMVGDWPAPATPLEALVAQMIRLADADTPLARADAAAQLAAVFSQAVTVLSVADLPDDAARVGAALDAVLDLGVAANLDRVVATDTTDKARDEVAKVRERAAGATEVLEENWAKAPPAARVGLERALEAADPGRGKASGKPPGKSPGGPPWKKGDGERPGKGVPPGWQKKP